METFFEIFCQLFTLIFYTVPALRVLAEIAYANLVQEDSWEEDYYKAEKYKQASVWRFVEEVMLVDGVILPLWKIPGLYTDLVVVLALIYLGYAFPVAGIIFYIVVNIGMRYTHYYLYREEIDMISEAKNKKHYGKCGWRES